MLGQERNNFQCEECDHERYKLFPSNDELLMTGQYASSVLLTVTVIIHCYAIISSIKRIHKFISELLRAGFTQEYYKVISVIFDSK